jgi:hypothetical protein
MRTLARPPRGPQALALLLLLSAAGPASAQERVSNARTERRQATQPLDREIQAIAARGEAAWVGYRLAAVPYARQLCNAPVQLEPAKEMIVLVRVAGGAVDRLRTFTPNCEIDAGDMPMTWLDGVTPDASATWLTSIIRTVPTSGTRDSSLMQPAMSALELNPGMVALNTLIGFARDDTRTNVRSRALNALAQRAEQEASATIQNAINNDPDTEVKKTAVGALARMPKDEGTPLLIQVARNNKNVDVRKQAMFWLGESKDPLAVTFFEEILKK